MRNRILLYVLCFILVIVSVTGSNGQEKADLVGKWKIDSARLNENFIIDPETASQMKLVLKILPGSTLEFKKNHRTTFCTPLPQWQYENLNWEYNSESYVLEVHSHSKLKQSESSIIMAFTVVPFNGGWIFAMNQSPFVFYLNRF